MFLPARLLATGDGRTWDRLVPRKESGMRGLLGAAGLALALLVLPNPSHALVELDVAFEPSAVCPGEEVQFFFSLENVGDEAELVQLSVTITFGEFQIGPFMGQVELAAGETAAKEIPFLVPPYTPAGTLVMTVTATDSDGTVEDTAELTINECGGGYRLPHGILGRAAKAAREITR
jgi:hypothetical protein